MQNKKKKQQHWKILAVVAANAHIKGPPATMALSAINTGFYSMNSRAQNGFVCIHAAVNHFKGNPQQLKYSFLALYIALCTRPVTFRFVRERFVRSVCNSLAKVHLEHINVGLFYFTWNIIYYYAVVIIGWTLLVRKQLLVPRFTSKLFNLNCNIIMLYSPEYNIAL